MMKKSTIYSILIFVICLQTTVIHARKFDLVINGMGDPKADVKAVQKAVDKGGSILLKGSFDFGKHHCCRQLN